MKLHVVQHNQAVFACDEHELLSRNQPVYHIACVSHSLSSCSMLYHEFLLCVHRACTVTQGMCMYAGRILLTFASLGVCSTVAQLTTTLRMRPVGLS